MQLFSQPMGVVDEAIEIDPAGQIVTVYPGTHSKSRILQERLAQRQSEQIKTLVSSEKFKGIPRENRKSGFDGTAYLSEVCIGDVYSWKLHWQPDDEELIKVVDHILALAKEVAERSAAADAIKPRH